MQMFSALRMLRLYRRGGCPETPFFLQTFVYFKSWLGYDVIVIIRNAPLRRVAA